MRRPPLLALCTGLLASACLAQTYSPKTIRLEGPNEADRSQVLRLIGLEQGVPVTREQIEAAMQRLADSGLFADLSYKVGPDALVFTLKPVTSTQELPVRYANLVWWRPGELEPLVEQRVPLFHGKLPLTGQLTDQVRSALVVLLAEKGVAGATVTAMPSNVDDQSIAMVVSQPSVSLGQVHLDGVAPDTEAQMQKVLRALTAQDFDEVTISQALILNTQDTHRNAGYLDVAVSQPTFAAPRKDMGGYLVDATATVTPGARYRVASISYEGLDAGAEATMAERSELKVGGPAGEMNSRITAGEAARALESSGHLGAKAEPQMTKDTTAHAVAYRIVVTPGPVYHYAGVDVTALPAEMQAQVSKAFHAQAGEVADTKLQQRLMQALAEAHVPRDCGLSLRLNRESQTALYVVQPRAGARAGAHGSE